MVNPRFDAAPVVPQCVIDHKAQSRLPLDAPKIFEPLLAQFRIARRMLD